MITPILTFLSTRIVYVFITTVVVVAAVPTLVIAIHGNTITITSAASSARRHDDDPERTRIVLEVKTAGHAVLVQLNSEEATCDTQISELSAKSKLSAAATAAAIKKGKDDFHAVIAPFVAEIQDDEDELDHLSVVTSTTEQTYLLRIREVEVVALGQTGHIGVVVSVCQTIVIQITQVVVVTPGGGGEGDDARLAQLTR